MVKWKLIHLKSIWMTFWWYCRAVILIMLSCQNFAILKIWTNWVRFVFKLYVTGCRWHRTVFRNRPEQQGLCFKKELFKQISSPINCDWQRRLLGLFNGKACFLPNRFHRLSFPFRFSLWTEPFFELLNLNRTLIIMITSTKWCRH